MSMPVEAPPAPGLVVRTDDGVPVLEIPEDLELEALRDWADAHLPAQAEALAGRSVRIDIGARPIQLFDLRRLIHHLEDQHEIAITGLYAAPDAVHRFAERELKLKLFVTVPDAPEPPAAPDPADDEPDPPVSLDPDTLGEAAKVPSTVTDDDADEAPGAEPATDDAPEAFADPAPGKSDPGRRTLHVNRTVRSGSNLRFDGDITIFGDVNPGAQVTASGAIVVLGALKGVAHAGATGADDAFILALQLRPTQLRIGRRIAIPPEDPTDGPEVAVLRDDRIVIEPYLSRLPARGT